jgi:hypothetical protein
MDLSFLQRHQATFTGSSAARLDYGVVIASLDAMQAASPSARALRSSSPEPPCGPGAHPLVELVLGGSNWREAISARCGCFNPEYAQHPGKAA